MTKYRLSELDTIFLSYDEGEVEANWHRVKDFNPAAKRVHGVNGFDRAHKLCASLAETDRFIIIDGDNWLHDSWIDPQADDVYINDDGIETACFSFSSINNINGLVYGNGGVKVWNRQTLLDVKTHEASSSTDFCWDIPYYQVNKTLSISVQNAEPHQAWRSGYREAVKMTQHEGHPRENLRHTWYTIYDKNLSRLNVWCTVGRDVKNGIWAMLGARQALYDMMSCDLDQQNINNYDWFKIKWDHLWEKIDGYGPEKYTHELRELLQREYNFYVPELDPKQSAWFKQTYINPPRQGLMK